MSTGFSNFFTATPKNVDRAIAIGITVLTLSTAVVLSRSSSVQITRDGLNIQRDLIEVSNSHYENDYHYLTNLRFLKTQFFRNQIKFCF